MFVLINDNYRKVLWSYSIYFSFDRNRYLLFDSQYYYFVCLMKFKVFSSHGNRVPHKRYDIENVSQGWVVFRWLKTVGEFLLSAARHAVYDCFENRKMSSWLPYNDLFRENSYFSVSDMHKKRQRPALQLPKFSRALFLLIIVSVGT